MFAFVPLMTGTVLFRNPGILTFGGNPVSYGQADSRDKKSLALTD